MASTMEVNRRKLLGILALLLLGLLEPGVGLSSPGPPYKEVANNSGRAQPVLDGATGQPVRIGDQSWVIAPGGRLLSHPWGGSPRFVYDGQSYHYLGSVGGLRFFVVPDWGGEVSIPPQGSAAPVPYTPVVNSSGRSQPVLDGASGQPVYIGSQPWTVAPGETILSHSWGDSPRFVYGGRSYHYIGSIGGSTFRFFLVEDWAALPISLQSPAGSMALREHATRIADLVNRERLKAGLSLLQPHPALVAAAENYAALLATRNWFNHVGPDGSTPPQRMEAAGYQWKQAWGENLAKDYPSSSAEELVAGWMDSPGHRAIILTPAFEETGVGCYPLAGGTKVLCVQMFGTR